MGLPQRLLGDGEHEVLHLRTHAKRLIGPALVLILTGGAVGVALALLPQRVQPIGGAVVIAVAVLIAITWVLVPFLRWRTTTYTVTDRRIVSRKGILSRTGHDLPLIRINDVSYERSLSDRFWGCGTLHVQTASDRPVVLPDIPDVEEVQVLIADLLYGDRADAGWEDGS